MVDQAAVEDLAVLVVGVAIQIDGRNDVSIRNSRGQIGLADPREQAIIAERAEASQLHDIHPFPRDFIGLDAEVAPIAAGSMLPALGRTPSKSMYAVESARPHAPSRSAVTSMSQLPE